MTPCSSSRRASSLMRRRYSACSPLGDATGGDERDARAIGHCGQRQRRVLEPVVRSAARLPARLPTSYAECVGQRVLELDDDRAGDHIYDAAPESKYGIERCGANCFYFAGDNADCSADNGGDNVNLSCGGAADVFQRHNDDHNAVAGCGRAQRGDGFGRQRDQPRPRVDHRLGCGRECGCRRLSYRRNVAAVPAWRRSTGARSGGGAAGSAPGRSRRERCHGGEGGRGADPAAPQRHRCCATTVCSFSIVVARRPQNTDTIRPWLFSRLHLFGKPNHYVWARVVAMMRRVLRGLQE